MADEAGTQVASVRPQAQRQPVFRLQRSAELLRVREATAPTLQLPLVCRCGRGAAVEDRPPSRMRY